MPEAVEGEAGSEDADGDADTSVDIGIGVGPGAGPGPGPGADAGTSSPAERPPLAGENLPEGTRRLTDPGALRALAHPTRLRLMEIVAMNATITATAAAEILGGTPAAAAYHLRMLGKHGFLDEAEGGAGRERPWKLGQRALAWDDYAEDPVERMTARSLTDIAYAGWIRRIERFRARHDEYPEAIRQLSGASALVFFATTEEMAQIQSEVWAIYSRYIDRVIDPSLRPEGAPPFEVVTFTFPYAGLEPDGAPLEGPEDGDEDESAENTTGTALPPAP